MLIINDIIDERYSTENIYLRKKYVVQVIRNGCLKLFKIFKIKALTITAPMYASGSSSARELQN